MRKAKLYLETTIVSYLTARPSSDFRMKAHQALTREWWENERTRFDVYISEVVLTESRGGDSKAAQKRLEVLADFPSLPMPEIVRQMARLLISKLPLPVPAANADALHLATAIYNEIEYLLTWNCRHLAHGAVRRKLAEICDDQGWFKTMICTPEELGNAEGTLERSDR